MAYRGAKKLGDFFSSRRERGISGMPTLAVTIDRGLVARDSIDRKMETNLSDEEHLLGKSGDIAYNMMRMWQGASGLVESDGLLSPAYIVLAPKIGVDSKYAAYLFKSSRLIYLFWAYSYGLTNDRLRLYFKDFKKIPVDLPPIPEQQKIAKILSTWDKAIEKLEPLIAAKQKRKKALMQQLLTGKKRFAGFEGEWKEIRLKKIIREEKSRNKNSEITRVLSVTNRNGFVLPEEQFSRQVASDDLSNYKIVRRGQFGYNPSRINVGSFARLDSYGEGVLSPMYVIFSINTEVLDSDFFLNWMSSHEAKQRILSSKQGTVRDSVGFDALSTFLINLPPIDEQQKIASVLSAADKEIETHQNQLSALKQQKKGLMQQLLTGKKRVKIDEPAQMAAVGA